VKMLRAVFRISRKRGSSEGENGMEKL